MVESGQSARAATAPDLVVVRRDTAGSGRRTQNWAGDAPGGQR